MLKGELYYRVAHAHRQEQDHRNRDFDLKAAGCLGIATTITGMGAILLNGFLNNSNMEMTTLSLVFIALSALVYICTLGCGLLAMRPREWRFDPDLSKFAAYLPDYDDEAFVEWAGDQFKNSAESNSKILARKAQFLMVSFLLTLSLPILLFALVLTFGDLSQGSSSPLSEHQEAYIEDVAAQARPAQARPAQAWAAWGRSFSASRSG